MNATELFLDDGKSAGIYFCGKCRNVARTPQDAEQCCENNICEKCGKDVGKQYRKRCDACNALDDAVKERERFDKAEKVFLDNWNSWVFCEGLGHNDGFFPSIEDMFDCVKTKDLPEYVWTCNPIYFAVADVSDITERISDNAYEGFDVDDLNGLTELGKAIDAFNEANKDVVSYEPDYTKAVLIAPRE